MGPAGQGGTTVVRSGHRDPDGLPYIGDVGDGQFVATGFSGSGYTFGTLAAIMVRDTLQESKNPWTHLFDPGRKSL